MLVQRVARRHGLVQQFSAWGTRTTGVHNQFPEGKQNFISCQNKSTKGNNSGFGGTQRGPNLI